METITFGEIINLLVTGSVGLIVFLLKKLINKVDQIGTRLTVLETEHNMLKGGHGCPFARQPEM